MSWADAVRLSGPAYSEIAFQAIYALRQGNLPTPLPDDGLAARARKRVTQSKVLVSGVLALVTLGGLVLLSAGPTNLLGTGVPHPLYSGAVLSGLLVVQMALLWWMGLQVIPTFLSSSVFPVLESLPVDSATVDRIGLILFLRLFDAPVLACLVLTPFAVGLAFGSPLAGLAILPGEVVVVVFALALALLTGRFFVRHVQGASGGRGRSALRWAYLVLWAIPAFAMYGFVTFAPRFLGLLAQLFAHGPDRVLNALLAAFPFPFGLLPAVALGASSAGSLPFAAQPLVVALGSAGYGLIGVGVFGWLRTAPHRLALLSPGGPGGPRGATAALHPTSVAVAVMTKDLRTASRTPGYAFLILLPMLDAVAIGLWTVVTNPTASQAYSVATAAVSTAALLATFFGPAFFAIEVMGYSYTRTLPLPNRSLLAGKVALVAALYLVAAGAVLGLTLVKLFDPLLFLVFVAAELPAVLAAALFEYGVLFWLADRKGLPIVNLYTGAWWATIVAVPGLVFTGVPLLAYLLIGPPLLAISALGALASAECVAVVAGISVARWRRRRRESR